MESGTIIMGVSLTLLLILPFLWMRNKNKKKEQQLLQKIRYLAEKQNNRINQFNIMHNTCIGIDESAKILFFYRKSQEAETEEIIPLSEIQKCRIINNGRTIKDNADYLTVIDRIALAFTYQNKSTNEKVLDFFEDHVNNPALADELLIAEKWCKLVNDSLTTTRKK